jgi:MoaA/NifB/PqqE/SkfB family radical SAM enzyme
MEMDQKTMKARLQKFGLNKALDYLDKDPEKNLPKLMNWVDKLAGDSFKPQRDAFRKFVNDPNCNWYKLMMSVWSDIDPHVRRVLFENFFLNASIVGWPKQEEYREKYNCNIPWAILMDPTSACNLHCTGCWAAEYGDKLNMSYETLDSIIKQGTEMGSYMYIYSGGEPLVRKKDIIKLCEAHSDCMFLAFTNGTLIDEQFADDMLRVGNFIPAISIEGFEAATDSRRGNGTYAAVIRAMDLLKKKKLPFGVSCCYTSANVDVIGSEEYFDFMVDKGVKFAWFFTYMPIGKEAVPALLATAEQREFMYHQIRKFRGTKPLFTMDFWNDGEYVDGCIAGGRRYLHINANGDVEPCAFIHYSDTNIHEKTLLDALRAPLFMAYHDNQPFNKNQLRPCPVLDNPNKLANVLKDVDCKSTDMQAEETPAEYCGKCVDTAEKWKPVADKLWDKTLEERKEKAAE